MEYNSSQELEYINTDEGRVRVEGSVYYYDYYLKDHLGNTRVMFTDSLGNAESLQVNNYYPFGMRFNQAPVFKSEENNNLTNGKEFQEDYGLNWTDCGARMYDAEIGRWFAIDPMAEEYNNTSPYCFVLNMPTIAFDPDGMKVSIIGDVDYVNQVKFQLALIAASGKNGEKLVLDAYDKKETLGTVNN